MGNSLKPGGLGDASEGSTPAAFADSMAAAMEVALNSLLTQEHKPPVPTDNSAETRDRRTMFLAIAQGIVNHLVANQEAFVITNASGTVIANRKIVINQA
jgi:hypothetical protein